MSGKRTRSFKCAVHHRDREVCSENDFHLVTEETPFFKKMVQVIAMEILPEERDRKYYADRYSCCPPPWFIIFITIIEVSKSLLSKYYFIPILLNLISNSLYTMQSSDFNAIEKFENMS